jgi:hypothetical protein
MRTAATSCGDESGPAPASVAARSSQRSPSVAIVDGDRPGRPGIADESWNIVRRSSSPAACARAAGSNSQRCAFSASAVNGPTSLIEPGPSSASTVLSALNSVVRDAS